MRRDRDREIHGLKGFDHRRGETLAADLDVLLADLCRIYGFCNHLSGDDLLRGGEPLTAERFADAVLIAEGFPEPEYEMKWRKSFRRIFNFRYGSSVSTFAWQNAGRPGAASHG
jgi:hypothetical protein